jgi:hypothetical protein
MNITEVENTYKKIPIGKCKNLSGKKFNMWTALYRTESDKNYKSMWVCRCDCGRYSPVRAYEVETGKSKSCAKCSHSGKRSSSWKGGRTKTSDGYVLIRVDSHPKAQKYGKYVPEHRIIMENIIGRYLKEYENVHHINGKRDDNKPENLELWSTSQPCGQRVSDKLRWAKEIIETYGKLEYEV